MTTFAVLAEKQWMRYVPRLADGLVIRHWQGVSVALEWKLADLWVGVFWKHQPEHQATSVWVCLVPCFPIHIWWWR